MKGDETEEATVASAAACDEDCSTELGLERVFLRLVMSSSDAKLQSFTQKYLLRVLHAAECPSLIPKISELLSHYNKRVRNNVEIVLPVMELAQFMQTKTGAQGHLGLIYLRFAYDRMSIAQNVELLPELLKAVAVKTADSQREEREDSIANALTKLAEEGKAEQLREMKSYLGGVSPHEFALIHRKVFVHTQHFQMMKRSTVSLLERGLLPDQDSFPLLVLAASSPINEVHDNAEGALRKVDSDGLLSKKEVIDDLFALFLGSAVDKKKAVNPMNFIYEATDQTKLKICSYLRKSTIAYKSFMTNLIVARNAAKATHFMKLQTSGLFFMQAILKNIPKAGAKALAPPLFGELRRLLDQSPAESRCILYGCLAQLGVLHPSLVTADMSFVQECFHAVDIETEAAVGGVLECLLTWLTIFQQNSDVTSRNLLQALVASFITHEKPRCRMVALKYISALLSPTQLDLHWMLLKASADRREEMQKEARRLLELSLAPELAPHPRAVIQELYPRWEEFCHDKSQDDFANGEALTESASMKKDEVNQLTRMVTVSLLSRTFARFIWACGDVVSGVRKTAMQQLLGDEGDGEWKSTMPKVLKTVFVPLIGSPEETHVMEVLLFAASNATEAYDLRIARALMDVCSLKGVSQKTINDVMNSTARLLRSTPRIDVSIEAAELYAKLLSTKGRSEDNTKETQEAVEILESKDYSPGRILLGAGLICGGWGGKELERRFFLNMEKRIVEGYKRPGNNLEASLIAVSNMATSKNLGLTVSQEECMSLIENCEKIAVTRQDGFNTSARDAAARCIGLVPLFCTGEGEAKTLVYEKSLMSLYSIGDGPPRPELQFAVGEALFNLALDRLAPSIRNVYVQSETDWKECESSSVEWYPALDRLSAVFKTLLEEKAASPNHHLRRAVLVWLLVLSQKLITSTQSGPNEALLRKLQLAFIDGLSEIDDFSQDIASKGLGLCYSKASGELRKELTGLLMASITGEKAAAKREVQESTPIFEGSAQLGKTPDGQGLSTYKELCSLATEMNNPDLLYKFMQLAKHNTAWNAKKGAAFGFSAVFEEARAELEPFVNQLVPKLYRYRHDPDAAVQSSMRSIWTTLTSSKKNIVNELADEIAREIIPTMTHKEWRVRESSCYAYAELLQGHATDYMLRELPECLKTVLRVQDDVKESVRAAADRAAASISSICIREAGSTKKDRSSALLDVMLPVIVDGAVNASVTLNKKFCLLLMVELSRECPRSLLPYIHLVIPCLLDAISDLEPAVLNYIAARSGRTDLEALDDARSRAAQTSPLMRACTSILQYVDGTSLKQIAPRLTEQLKASVGVSTRNAAAQLVTHLVLLCPQLLMDNQQICDKMFSVLRSSALKDRNPSVRKQFSSTLSYLARFVSHSQIESLLIEARKYMVGSEEEGKVTVRNILRNLAVNASELLTRHVSMLVPYVFLEKCQQPVRGDEESKKRSEAWEELWSEIVPSTDSAIRLYGEDILKTAVSILQENQVWAVKANAAVMIAETVRVADSVDHKLLVNVLLSLISLLSGRYWTGKERLPEAISSLFRAVPDMLRLELTPQQQIECMNSLKKECEKKRQIYSLPCTSALAYGAAALHREDLAEWIRAKAEKRIKRALAGESECSSSDDDAEVEGKSKVELETDRQARLATTVYTVCIAIKAYQSGENAKGASNFLSQTLQNSSVFYRVKQAISNGLEELFEKFSPDGRWDFTQLACGLTTFAKDMVTAQRRSIAVQSLNVIARMLTCTEAGTVALEGTVVLARISSLDLNLASEIGLVKKLQSVESSMEVD